MKVIMCIEDSYIRNISYRLNVTYSHAWKIVNELRVGGFLIKNSKTRLKNKKMYELTPKGIKLKEACETIYSFLGGELYVK